VGRLDEKHRVMFSFQNCSFILDVIKKKVWFFKPRRDKTTIFIRQGHRNCLRKIVSKTLCRM